MTGGFMKTADKEMNMVKLTIPLFFESLLGILISNVDQLMLSAHSREAIAAGGNAGQISWIMILFFQVLGTAALILIAQYQGAGKEKEAQMIYPVTLIFNTMIGILVSAVSVFGIDAILRLMNIEDPVTFEYAKIYMQIVGVSFLFVAISNCFGVFLKANAIVKEVVVISVFINLLNVVGNGIGLFVLDLGVAGVAYSTLISRFVGMILVILVFYRKVGKIHFSAVRNGNPYALLWQLLRIGVPSAGENISYDLSQLVIMSFVNLMGIAAINAKVYVGMVVQFAYLFCTATSQAMQIVEGYQIGAGNKDEAEKVVFQSLRGATIVGVGVTIILYFFSDTVVGIFPSADAEVLRIAKQLLLIEIFLEIGRVFNITMVRALQTAGDVKYPVAMNVIFSWGLSVVCGYILGVLLGWGIVGVWIAAAADELIRGILLIIRFKAGKWKKISLVKEQGFAQ